MPFSTRNSVISHFYGCHSWIINNKINRLHERCLRIIYGDKQLLFEDLLEKRAVFINERNLQILATETYKASKGMLPPQITKLFARRNEHLYNFTSICKFCTLWNWTISYLGPKIWGMVPYTYKNIVYKRQKG